MENRRTTVYLFSILSILLSNTFYSQTVTSQSYQTYFGGANNDIGYKIIESKLGGYYVIGQTTRDDDNITDIYLAKLDDMAVPVWAKTFGGSGIDIGKSIIELSDSGLIILGHTTSFGAGGYDAVVIRTNKAGEQIWQKTIGGSDWEFANALCVSGDNHILVCGYTYSNQATGIDPFVTKLTMTGNEVWTKVFTGSKDDLLNDIIELSGNTFALVGIAKSYGDANGDLWLLKMNALGDTVLTKRWGGSKRDVGNALITDKNGDLLIAGGTENNNTADGNALILKADQTFSVHWSRDYGAPDKNEVAVDVLNSGSNYGSMLLLYTTEEVTSNGKDVKNILLNSGGYYLRGGSKGGPNNDECFAMCNAKDKGYIACGYTESFTARLKDVYIIKYDSEMTIGPIILSTPETDRKTKSRIKLYPTLVEDYFFIESEKTIEPSAIVLVNSNGVYLKPKSIEVEDQKYKVTLPPSLKGAFFVRVFSSDFFIKCIAR